MKKIISIICSMALVVSLTACADQTNQNQNEVTTETEKQKETGGQTITGSVTAIDGTTVTLQTGMQGGGQEPPQKPEGTADGQEPPQKPEGTEDGQEPPQKPEGTEDGQEPPQKPEGTEDGQEPPQMPDGAGMGESRTLDIAGAKILKEDGDNTVEAAIDDIQVGTYLEIELDEDDTVIAVTIKSGSGMQQGEPQAGGFGGSGEVTQGTSANTIDTDGDVADTAYESTGDDENALRVDGANVTLSGITVDKSSGSSSNTEDGDFYGMNAALLATNGADVTITNATVTSSAQNGNGVFSYGSGTTVTISDSTITTTADNSGGIQTTGGGTTNASNLTVTTSGNSAAAIRSDRGGGTVKVNGGSYTTNGYNSPAVYSTADITVENAKLTAANSEALVIEGKNSITLKDCTVTGNMSDTKGSSSDENVHNVMIYQSMSGDADVGTSEFAMTGGTLQSNNGDLFYVTNTHCILTLENVTIDNKETDGYLLRVTGNSASHGWGTAGSNGAQVEFTANEQTLSGDILVDSISTLNMTLSGNSNYTGAIQIVENADNGTAVSDNAVVTVEEGSTWTLTGDCTLTSLENHGTINYNGYTITLTDGTVLS